MVGKGLPQKVTHYSDPHHSGKRQADCQFEVGSLSFFLDTLALLSPGGRNDGRSRHPLQLASVDWPFPEQYRRIMSYVDYRRCNCRLTWAVIDGDLHMFTNPAQGHSQR